MGGPRCAAPGKKSRYLQKRGVICPAYSPQNSVLRIGPLCASTNETVFLNVNFSLLFFLYVHQPLNIVNDPAVK